MPHETCKANVVGRQMRKARYQLKLTQEQFSGRCQLVGLDISRATLAQIGSQVRFVTDEDRLILASQIEVSTDDRYPAAWQNRRRRRRQ